MVGINLKSRIIWYVHTYGIALYVSVRRHRRKGLPEKNESYTFYKYPIYTSKSPATTASMAVPKFKMLSGLGVGRIWGVSSVAECPAILGRGLNKHRSEHIIQ